MCEILEVAECGKGSLHAFVLTTALIIPVALVRRLRYIAIVNSIIMVMTLVAIGIVIYYSTMIYLNTSTDNETDYSLTLNDRSYKYWDLGALALFMSGF